MSADETTPPEAGGTPAEAPAETPAAVPAEAAPATAPEAAAPPPTESAAADPAPAPADLPPAEVAKRLGERFPALFGGPAKPIKLRIQADIQQRAPGEFTKRALSAFLHRHTTSTAYLRALVAAQARVDLDGAPAGEIAEEHKAAAQTELERRRVLHDARRVFERAKAKSAGGPQALAATGSDGAPRPPRPDRPPRGPRPPQGARPDRPPRPEGTPHGGRPQRPDRPPRGDRPPRPDPGLRAERPPRSERPERPERPPSPAPEAAPSADPDVAARRERALLLRAWETSTLTRANFCVLKRIAAADLDAQLELARRERAEHAPQVGGDGGRGRRG
jgi:sRNA-binding protein